MLIILVNWIGIGVYGGLFHVTETSLLLETFLFVIGSLILISWPITKSINSLKTTLNSSESSNELNITSNTSSNAIEYSLVVLFTTLVFLY